MKIPELRKWNKAYAVYSFAALLVLFPLLWPGYILTLDLVFTPQLRMPDTITSSYVFRAGLHLLNLVLPSQVIEKIMLFVILLLSGVGMHLLMRWLQGRDDADWQSELGAYFAGLLYMVNPFTYSRFMAGQYSVLLGYALLPWFVRALLQFVEKPDMRRTLPLTAWALAISIVSIHSIGLMAVLVVVAGVLAAWRYRERSDQLVRLLKYSLMALVIFLVASSYWLVPLIRGHGNTAAAIDTFRAGQSQAFAAVGDGTAGKLVNVARLQGFWAEGQNLYLLPQDIVRPWGLFALAIWVLVVIGAVSYWRSRRRQAVLLFGAAAAWGGLLAAGIGNGWLAGHLPFFAGYREPQKFAALVALGYAILAGHGAVALARRYHPKPVRIGVVVALLTVLVGFTPVMWRGFDGQLMPRQYPADWFAVNRRLNGDTADYKVLFLPWHLYMRFQFAGRIIANPADTFFDKPVLISDQPEFDDVSPAVPDAGKRLLSAHILPAAPRRHDLGGQLAPLGVKYILLDKDFDYRSYDYLDRQTDLRPVAQGPKLVLYRNLAFKGAD